MDWKRARQAVVATAASLREYAGGVRPHDVRRLFERDAPDVYSVLTRDQPAASERGPKAAFEHAKRLFLGLSYQLTPVRRTLFAAALLLALVGSCDVRWRSGAVSVDAALGPYLLSLGLLVFLLALELVDRIRVRDELEVARQLQRELLPHVAPDLPGYGFAFSYRTANEIGGDYYQFRPLGDGRLAVIAGDASGHGIAAGLVMVIAHSTLELAMELDPAPDAVLRLLDRALVRTGGQRAFMTLFYGVLEPASGRLEYVCAGHPFPLLRRAGGTVEELGEGGFPAGLRSRPRVAQREVTLAPGDLLLVYSDGLPEAVSASRGTSFGFERLPGLLAGSGGAAEVQERVLDELDRFLGAEPLADDVSLVVVERSAEQGTRAGAAPSSA